MKLQNVLLITTLMLPAFLSASENPEQPPKLVTYSNCPGLSWMMHDHLRQYKTWELMDRAFFTTASLLATGVGLYKYIPDNAGYYKAPLVVAGALIAGASTRRLTISYHQYTREQQTYGCVVGFKKIHGLTEQNYKQLVDTFNGHTQVEKEVKNQHPHISRFFNQKNT